MCLNNSTDLFVVLPLEEIMKNRYISDICRRFLPLAALALCLPVFPAYALDILVTNDDGYQSEGIITLASTLRAAGHNVLVVAPCGNQSGVSAAFNTGFGEPTDYRKISDRRYCVEGTPVDAVLMALYVLGPELGVFGPDGEPDLVVSGINHGANVGILTIHSGTVGATVRAIREGIPAIAVSAGLDITEARSGFPSTLAAYPHIANLVVDIIASLQNAAGDRDRLLPLGMGLNVNWPVALPEGKSQPLGIRFTRITNSTGFNLVPVRQPDGSIIIQDAPIDDLIEYEPPVFVEGDSFQKGYITISAIEGNYGANRVKRELMRVRLDGELEAP